ncbi:hypothetical protein E2C01_071244 [Portunus trituberculatus]|uniref:Uncharacterized protein n=1 Tax=Portunus trituberculatus TaxID=210409 RepID=A0A5B7HZG8_PORTR|nr:hypothetical protein [Portunus trituberculatus]
MAAGRGVTGKGWARVYIIYLFYDELWRHLGAGEALRGDPNSVSGGVRGAAFTGQAAGHRRVKLNTFMKCSLSQ